MLFHSSGHAEIKAPEAETSTMVRASAKARTMLNLGALNVARVAWYRTAVRLRVNSAQRVKASPASGIFFETATRPPISTAPTPAWRRHGVLFGYLPVALGADPPEWLADPITGVRFPSPERSWWEIPDFDPATGDIKRIWELSRFDWVVAFAQQARNRDPDAVDTLNGWLSDWSLKNPPYRGPNWKCGQEASIRIMHLAAASMILGSERRPTRGLLDLVRNHLQRIAPTIQYALAQDNNHGVSEAAALFIGGSWLVRAGVPEGARWQSAGRYWLEERAARLIQQDGSFSQYSVNYHRLMLDAFCLVEVWRRRLDLCAFSKSLHQRVTTAAEWLHRITDPETGDAPNVGANDGARLLPLTETPYRDYRPTVCLALALFANERAWPTDGPWNRVLEWLDISLPSAPATRPMSHAGEDGGFAVLKRDRTTVLLRYPRFRFRPSQADALHVDLWCNGHNLLRDGGSYSYNSEEKWLKYFNGAQAHNTVEFDGRDQMPRMGRFLFADWISTCLLEELSETEQTVSFAAGYQDRAGARHVRRVILGTTSLKVEDDVAGFESNAILRWRLTPDDWLADSRGVRSNTHELTIKANMPIKRMELVRGWESRHYLEKTEIPVLEVEMHEPGSIVSEFTWQA